MAPAPDEPEPRRGWRSWALAPLTLLFSSLGVVVLSRPLVTLIERYGWRAIETFGDGTIVILLAWNAALALVLGVTMGLVAAMRVISAPGPRAWVRRQDVLLLFLWLCCAVLGSLCTEYASLLLYYGEG